MKKKIGAILLGAEKQVGKDTFFRLISEENDKYVRISFADEVRAVSNSICKYFFNKNADELNLTEKELFRPILLKVGSLGRNIDPNFWVDKTLAQLKENLDKEKITVFTDCRHLNEYEKVACFLEERGYNCLLIILKRKGAPEPTDEEKKNAPLLEERANGEICWESFGPSFNESDAKKVVFSLLETLENN